MKKDSDKVEMLGSPLSSSEKEMQEPSVTFQKRASIPIWVWVLLVIALLLFLAGFITLMIAVTRPEPSCKDYKGAGDKGKTGSGGPSACKFSAEADRVNLPSFLKKVQSAYYAMNTHYVVYQPAIVNMDEHVRQR